jgi:acyl carrier protein phosphodiesterase
MNYLAHAYLSFGTPGITVGNMISDEVKGQKILDYPPEIQQGIRLHRMIDAFTDTHPATREAKQIFRPAYRLYGAAFVDIVYDHFLAGDEAYFTDTSLLAFSRETYENLEPYRPSFPERFGKMFPYMKEQNWLYNYQFRWGIHNSFNGLVRRARYLSEADTAFELFESNYETLRLAYRQFMPDVKAYAETSLAEIRSGAGSEYTAG